LNPLQQELLAVLAGLGSVSLSEIMAALSSSVPRRTVQDNLQLLDTLGLVEHRGRGGGARWMLKGATKQ
jgi:hypothetical protein